MLAGTGTSTTTTPRTGYGSVPGPIGIPPNVFTQLSGAVPGFSGLTSGTSNLISSQESGNVSPQTLNALKTGAAQFGVASGMPGSGLESNQLFGNIAGFSEGQQQKGIQNYLALISGLGPTMTNPNLAADISARNTDLAAAPDPKLAAQEQFNLWLKGAGAAQSLANPARGPWWAPGGVSSPPIGATIGRSYPGGVAGFGSGGTDSLGFPTYQTPEAGTTATLGAINPTNPSGSQSNSDYSNFYPGMTETPGGIDWESYAGQ
jgi:hypothetical protein